MDNYSIFSAPTTGTFSERLEQLHTDISDFLHTEKQECRYLQYVKVFLSDAANQESELMQSTLMGDLLRNTPFTVIQQPPVNGAKIALLIKTSDEENQSLFHAIRLTDEEAAHQSSYVQTIMLFDKYLALLQQQGLNLKEHCVRTWIYVRDIDTNYDGVVKARNDVFRQHGLTIDTHFIASTGIGGRSMGKNVCVAIDFLTARDIRPEDKLYLKAPDHLNPTHEYGVAFERGVRVALPHKYEYFISGTASIDHRGEVINVGNVTRQAERLLENISALLADGNATMADVKYYIIYLRDLADATAIDQYMQEVFPDVPRIITHAKVCRPAWLVEMECIAERTIES